MIRAVFSRKAGELSLELSGHSGQAPAGQDLVCAAVSSLSCGLMDYVNQKASGEASAGEKKRQDGRAPELRLRPGYAFIRAFPEGESAQELTGAFELAERFMALLAENYPENVRVEKYLTAPKGGKEHSDDN